MNLSSFPGVPTHTRGETLDLTWSIYGTLADTMPDLNSESDHHTRAGDVPKPNVRGFGAIRSSRLIQVKD